MVCRQLVFHSQDGINKDPGCPGQIVLGDVILSLCDWVIVISQILNWSLVLTIVPLIREIWA